MQVVENLLELEEPLGPSVLTIGNFDGVHIAHQQLLRRVVESARKAGAQAVAVTFDPHPARILAPDRAPQILTNVGRKARLIERLGVDLLVVLRFTQELARLSPSDFVQRVLAQRLHPLSVLVGPNFRFGHRQAGTTETLEEFSTQHGFKVEVLPMLVKRGDRVSSTRIRQLLAEGRVGRAGRLLGRPYSNEGPIVSGIGVGHRQTVPTLNLAPVEEMLPKMGVYVTRTRMAGRAFDSVTNVGHKPTFGEHRLTVESHLLDYQGEISETSMEIEYLHRLRDEKKFPDAASLKAQIQRDAARASQFFRLLRLTQNRRRREVAAGQ